MPRYRVRDGSQLAHGGTVLEAGAIVELPRTIAADMAVSGHVEEIDAQGQPIASVPPDDLERFRTHERVSILRDRLAMAKAKVDAIQAQLEFEEQRLADAVTAAAGKRPKPTPPATPAKE